MVTNVSATGSNDEDFAELLGSHDGCLLECVFLWVEAECLVTIFELRNFARNYVEKVLVVVYLYTSLMSDTKL